MPSEQNLRVSHPSNYGQVLIGAAQLDISAIQWNGGESVNILLRTNDYSFGFTGPNLSYLGNIEPGKWLYEAVNDLSISSPPNGPDVGYFFAPNRVGNISPENTADIGSPTGRVLKKWNVQGVGIEDSPVHPAITLDVTATGQADFQGDEITLKQGALKFAITPRVNSALVPAGTAPVKYVFVELLVNELNTGCTGSDRSFRERGVTQNDFSPAAYYQYLNVAGPTQDILSCNRPFVFLAAVGRTFEIAAENIRPTKGGRVEYTFYVRGHYTPSNPGKWPGSRKTFYLKADVVPPPPPLPSLGNVSAMLPSRQIQQVSYMKVKGGAIAGGKVADKGITIKQHEYLRAVISFEIYGSYVGKPAETLVVVGYQAAAGAPMGLSYQNAARDLQAWDGQVPHLGSREQVSLPQGDLELEVFNGPFTRAPGIYTLHAGYRLQDGTLFFNGNPVVFTVTP